jgi:hypothetical protein
VGPPGPPELAAPARDVGLGQAHLAGEGRRARLGHLVDLPLEFGSCVFGWGGGAQYGGSAMRMVGGGGGGGWAPALQSATNHGSSCGRPPAVGPLCRPRLVGVPV